ncbi:citrate/2-methylcitrate synthase [Amycolatopsis jejuensis]|uniref:citrate/2-methylcitrate synthase n=1 Tax=Amycolatopsis jejuensis TaxID=330084 RepID=UPI0005242519|nr:citrate/2-methylcitrate synthase [Amycolatopsis jejuensis]
MPEQSWTTAVGEVGHGVVNVRGYPLTDIIRSLSFADATFLTIRGELPTPAQSRTFEAALNGILEHGFYAPTTLAARMVASAAPESVIPGVAAGMLTIGSITVSPQHTAEVIDEIEAAVVGGSTPEAAVDAYVSRMQAAKKRMPGIGHPLHPEGDPRAIALREVAEANGVWGTRAGYYFAAKDEYLRRIGRDFPVNIDGMLGCVLSELGFRPLEMPGIAAISFMPGIVAHCVEELLAPPTLRVAEGVYHGHAERRLNGSSTFGADGARREHAQK